ncbi:MAG: hypothetical protein EP339_00680 [Gammaproteobacteria bacterium]|nr:MAG: hypothetical protein EP339_00680 [Gammaproteobacteria bacterium]
MERFIGLIFFLVIIVLLALLVRRGLDHLADRRRIAQLALLQSEHPAPFSLHMIKDLPEPARRFFQFCIEPGTPLFTVAFINMTGQFGMGTKAKPDYLKMAANQALACPAGFVWKMNATRGLMRVSGSDSASWTRFWLMGLLPVARMGNNPDHKRSAFGRYVSEAVIWSPAAVLPGPDIEWTLIGNDCARVTVWHDGLEQSVDITVDEDGRPTTVSFERWTNANPEKRYQLQPFGAFLSDYESFQGFRLPTHVEAGNDFGTDRYFPFFIADVRSIMFPPK